MNFPNYYDFINEIAFKKVKQHDKTYNNLTLYRGDVYDVGNIFSTDIQTMVAYDNVRKNSAGFFFFAGDKSTAQSYEKITNHTYSITISGPVNSITIGFYWDAPFKTHNFDLVFNIRRTDISTEINKIANNNMKFFKSDEKLRFDEAGKR